MKTFALLLFGLMTYKKKKSMREQDWRKRYNKAKIHNDLCKFMTRRKRNREGGQYNNDMKC